MSDIDAMWNKVVRCGGSAAIWRLPYSSEFHFIGDLSGNLAVGNFNLNKSGSGFVLSPFMNVCGAETLFLKPDKYSVFTVDDLLVNEPVSYHIGSRYVVKGGCEHRAHFVGLVDAAVAAIKADKFNKVVLSRGMSVVLEGDINVFNLLLKMNGLYPAAFVCLVSIPEVGTWMGASPELLVGLSDNNFRTVSLAGTKPYVADIDLVDVSWTQKEIEEQSMVSRYIVEQFKAIRVRGFVEDGPVTVRAGNVVHLRTDYSVDLQRVCFPDLGSKMLRLLHPTSAVCGMPYKEALDFIVDNEGLNRGLYSGYWGAVNFGGESQVYVNLRCMNVYDSSVVVYAGAGVTGSSVACREWEETVVKCQSLLDVVRG